MDQGRKEALDRMFDVAIAVHRKPLADLTEHEKLCIAVAAGCEIDPFFCGIRLKNEVAFTEVDGKLRIFEKVGP